MPVLLCIVYGCLHITIAELSNYKRYHIAIESKIQPFADPDVEHDTATHTVETYWTLILNILFPGHHYCYSYARCSWLASAVTGLCLCPPDC